MGPRGRSLLLPLLIVACNTPEPQPLRVAEPVEITAINPALDIDGFGAEAQYLVLDSLIERDAQLRAVPRLLQRWDVLDAGKRFRMTLRTGILFHDGKPLTADDVIFTLDEIRRPENHSNYAWYLRNVEAVRKIDEHTVELELAVAAPRFYEVLEFGVLPKHLLAGQALRGNAFNWHPVGAGPYRIKSLDATHMELAGFDRYYGGRPAVPRISITRAPADELWRLLLTNRIDIALDIPWSRRTFLAGQKSIHIDESGRQMGVALWLNTRRGAFASLPARRDLFAAIDRVGIVQRAQDSFGTPSDRLDPRDPLITRPDTRRARTALAGQQLRIAVVEGYGPYEEIAVQLQRDLASIGIDLKLVPISVSALMHGGWMAVADCFLSPVWGPGPMEMLGDSYKSNDRLGLNHPDVDGLLDAITSTEREDLRTIMFHQMEQLIADEAVFTVIAWRPYLSASRSTYCDFHMVKPFDGLDRIRPCR